MEKVLAHAKEVRQKLLDLHKVGFREEDVRKAFGDSVNDIFRDNDKVFIAFKKPLLKISPDEARRMLIDYILRELGKHGTPIYYLAAGSDRGLARHFKVIHVDINPEARPDIVANIEELDKHVRGAHVIYFHGREAWGGDPKRMAEAIVKALAEGGVILVNMEPWNPYRPGNPVLEYLMKHPSLELVGLKKLKQLKEIGQQIVEDKEHGIWTDYTLPLMLGTHFIVLRKKSTSRR